jgi:homoserine dehydrogenase
MTVIPLIQLGLGGVGRALVQQVLQQRTILAQRYNIIFTYHALLDSSAALYDAQGLSPAELEAALAAKNQGQSLRSQSKARPVADWRELVPSQPAIIIDVTAQDGLEAAFSELVGLGHRIALANKRPLCGEIQHFKALTSTGATRYEATVGAGLPVISTLQSLLDTGDRILKIEACLSGTLGYLSSRLEEDAPLSESVKIARSLGWTEPDPRDDLSGQDVARKALILARSCGRDWSFSDVAPEAWYPPELASLDVEGFMEQVQSLDQHYRERIAQTRANGAVLRYVATVKEDGASVGFRELPLSHPLASLKGADNLISFTTERYNERPLVVRGPGAGVDVTAAGVLSDLIAHAREL